MPPPTTPPGMMPPPTTPPPTMPPPVNPGTLLPPRTRVSEIEMPPGVAAILNAKCAMCHSYGQTDPAGWGFALDLSRMIAADIVVPGNPDNSRLWQRVAVKADMPFNGARLSSTELQVLRAWIANINRPFVRARSNEELLDVMVTDLNKVAANQRGDVRWISIAHYLDEKRAPEEIRAAEAVLNLALNGLSRRATLVKLEAADAQRTIFRFRLSQLGWGEDEWDDLVSFYPYCLRSDRAAHRTLYDRVNTEAPFVRGDWFLATATKPPLYNRLLDHPDTIDQLADDLGVDINENINHPGRARPNVQRFGTRSSGVSLHNRIFERHRTRDGGYLWVSYDFDSDVDRADVRENPLGPTDRDEQNFEHTFDHKAGEMIYSLRNGLQGYFLAVANGNRIDEAVQTIVKDRRRPTGNVTNGLSCHSCHGVTGMNLPRSYDEIPKYVEEHRRDFNNDELTEIRNLYPLNGQVILTTDAERYRKAKEAVGGLRSEPGVVEYDDLINLVGQYEAKVGLRAGAVELGVDIATLRNEVNRGDNEDDLPLTVADPLVTRDDFVCRFRRIVRDVRRVNFCGGTFNAAEVQNFCDNR
jgi:serine/threonine-protein kinase